MYSFDTATLRRLRGLRGSGIGPNVYFLGLTSLLTDVSSEMVASILPIYLVVGLGLAPWQFGVVEGLHQGVAAVARLLGGVLADRWRRHRDTAAIGYGLSAVCKLALPMAGQAWLAITTIVGIDRFGKGLRTAPRDALISLSCEPRRLGAAFGVHRAMDTAGALLGPLAAFAILGALAQAYDVVFVVSFFVAVIGCAVLLLLVRERPDDIRHVAARPGIAAWMGLLRHPPYRALLLAGGALGAATVSDAFLYLALQERAAIDVALFPLLYVATAAVFLVLAIPAGRLGDRWGRGRVFLLGHALLPLAYLAPLGTDTAAGAAWLALGLLGAYYACTDGVLMAMAGAVLPEAHRAAGMALLITVVGLARLLASVVFGALWSHGGIGTALTAFAVALALALAMTARMVLRMERHGEPDQ